MGHITARFMQHKYVILKRYKASIIYALMLTQAYVKVIVLEKAYTNGLKSNPWGMNRSYNGHNITSQNNVSVANPMNDITTLCLMHSFVVFCHSAKKTRRQSAYKYGCGMI